MGRLAIPSSTIKSLYGKSGNICAFPDCLKTNINETTNENLSDIAHIKAYNPTGPRYDSSLKDEDKNSVDNLLILCRKHHKEIDHDNPSNYPVEDLQKMKQDHESKVHTYYLISKEGLLSVIDGLEKELITKNQIVEQNYNIIIELSTDNKLYKEHCDTFLLGFIELLEELFPLKLPGIQHGRLEQPFENIPKDVINSIRDKCENTRLINDDGSPVNICLDLKNDWKAQRVWFMIGNFWFYDLQDEKAFFHYDFLKDVEIVLNEETGEPSITDKVFYFNYAYTIGQRGDHKEEIKWYDKVTEVEPQNYKAWYNKSFAYDRLELFNEALVCANEAIRINPIYNYGWFAKGIAHASLKEYKEAVSAYRMTILVDPTYYEAYTNLGATIGLMGDYKGEVHTYNQIIAFNSSLSDIWHNRGTALARLNKFKSAIDSFDVALDIEPDKFDSLHNRAFSLSQLNRLNEAVLSYNKAIEVDDQAKALNDLAATYLQLGKIEKARDTFARLLQKLKTNQELEEPEIVESFLANMLNFSKTHAYDDMLLQVTDLYCEIFPDSEFSRMAKVGKIIFSQGTDKEN